MRRDSLAFIASSCAAAAACAVALAQGAAPPVVVTPDNFNRAESDSILALHVRQGMLGKFVHIRDLPPVDNRGVVRPSRDTLVSLAVFDLAAGPVTITLPDAGRRYMALQVIDEDQYSPNIWYGRGTYTLDRKKIGTRYVLCGIRMQVDPADPKDIATVRALQDAVRVRLVSPGRFEIPNWDPMSQAKVRDALIALGATLPDLNDAFGPRGRVDPLRHLVGTAVGWGGTPERDAMHIDRTPEKNDGQTIHRLRLKDVPVDGFWSITVYDADGFIAKNPTNAYVLSSTSARRGPDGTVAIQFGGCDGKVPNCLPVTPGWSYKVRLYRPRAALLDGHWKFPEARPGNAGSG
jgi:hypothetical protein